MEHTGSSCTTQFELSPLARILLMLSVLTKSSDVKRTLASLPLSRVICNTMKVAQQLGTTTGVILLTPSYIFLVSDVLLKLAPQHGGAICYVYNEILKLQKLALLSCSHHSLGYEHFQQNFLMLTEIKICCGERLG